MMIVKLKPEPSFLMNMKGLIKKARGKTTIVAIHHPMFTNGSHGGQYSLNSNHSTDSKFHCQF